MFLGGYYIYAQTQRNTTLYAYSFSEPIEYSFSLLGLAYVILLITFVNYVFSKGAREKKNDKEESKV